MKKQDKNKVVSTTTTAQLALRVMDHMVAVHELSRTQQRTTTTLESFAESVGKAHYDLANKIQTLEVRIHEVERVLAEREGGELKKEVAN